MIEQRKPRMQAECEVTVDDGIATAMHATRAAAHSQLEYCSPGSIVFGCDMVLNIPFHTDLIMLQDRRQQKIDARLVHANARRTHYDFQPGMKVYVLTDHKSKLDPVYQRPYEHMCTYEWHCYNPIISEYGRLSEYTPLKAGIIKRISFSPNGHSQVWESKNTMGFPLS